MTYLDPSLGPSTLTTESALDSWPLTPDVAEAECDDSPRGLNLQMTRALIMLVEGKRINDIAHELGVHRVTVFRWTTHPDFQRELNL